MTILQNSLNGTFGQSGDIANVPPMTATIGPIDVMHTKERIEVHTLATNVTFSSWQRMASRLVTHGPVYTRTTLGNPRFRWKQNDFALSTFNCIGKDMDMTISNCVEVGWATHEEVWEAVEMCEKYGINLIFQDLKYFGGMMFRHDDRLVDDDVCRCSLRC